MRLTGRDPASGRSLRITARDGRIAEVSAADGPAELWLAPGLVDLQVNGYAGHDVNAPDVDEATVTALVRALHETGVTTVVPTIVSAPEERIVAALSAIAGARAADPLVAHTIPYAHVEGPFLSGEEGPRGAHDPRHIRPADPAELRRWGGLAGMVTVSPHDDAAIDLIARATREGTLCAVGHTHATPEQITRAVDAGAVLSTHLGNATYASLPRHPNHLWTQLADDRLHAGFIADGHHLPADTFRAMLRAKGIERAHLVSDVTALGGMPPGRYRTPVGGEVELSADGRLSRMGTPFLAGASRSLAGGVASAVAMADLTLSTALRLASANPGRFAGGRGVLRVGAPADLIAFAWRPGEPALDVRTVVVAGQAVLER
ncbi:MAG: N-acetylglucosamine-6-phosphate deacetylase [Actinoallomurus sp.]